MRNSKPERPNYGYYALPILTILLAIVFVVGFLLAVFVWLVPGLILMGFGIYVVLSYAVSLLLMNQTRASELPGMIELEGEEEVLDVGCGLGKMTIGIAKHLKKGKVIGIDIWNRMEIGGNSAENAYENAERERVRDRVEFKYGNLLEIPFGDGSFDVVTAQSVLNNLHGEKDKSKAFREIQRVLKPNGKFLMLEPLRNLRGFFTFTPFAFSSLMSKDKWLELLKKAGFISIRYAYENGLGVFLAEKPI
jgi:ubiquinone/menaquinone biosynthesis C-methylase UbiE